MRIIAGTRKGNIIAAPRGEVTRPTADKVRGAVFNMLGDVTGMNVLDLFAGSGGLALEALSRGAAAAQLVDNRKAAVQAITANIAKLRFDNAQIKRRDYRSVLKSAVKKGERFDLIFVDPPYKMLRVVLPELVEWLPAVSTPGAVLVVESSAREPASLPFEPISEKSYGDTKICIYRLTGGKSCSKTDG